MKNVHLLSSKELRLLSKKQLETEAERLVSIVKTQSNQIEFIEEKVKGIATVAGHFLMNLPEPRKQDLKPNQTALTTINKATL